MTTMIDVRDVSQVAEARRTAVGIAEKLGFDDGAAGRVAIVATELGSNLVKHGGGGTLLAEAVDEDGEAVLQLVAVDRGRGMADISRCLEDGYSTQGSAGQGLGAIRRQAGSFDIASWPGLGSAVLARVGRPRPGRTGPGKVPRWGAVRLPYPGEEVCGDDYAVAELGGRVDVLLADGLGHGFGAAAAAMEAVRVFERNPGRAPEEIVGLAHAALRATRGAAVAVARIDGDAGRVAFSGLGNIAGAVVGPDETKRMVSMNGTAGLAMHRIQTFDYRLERGSVVVLHSDGVSTSWDIDRYPGLACRHPALVAAVLWKDFARGRDDATVVVVRGAAP